MLMEKLVRNMDRTEYPRPQLVRENWQNLNGVWNFSFDDEDNGLKNEWYLPNKKFPLEINVPFAFQSKKSGIHDIKSHEVIWYKRSFEVKKRNNMRYILHFGAVDYFSKVYVNGSLVGSHEGGHTSFAFDITDSLNQEGNNTLALRVFDPQTDESIPRGKQTWEGESRGIWYTNTSGIWQTVWLEELSDTYIEALKVTPLFDEGKALIECEIKNFKSQDILSYEFFFSNELVTKGKIEITTSHISFVVDLFQRKIFNSNYHGEGRAWTPDAPNLFDFQLEVNRNNSCEDRVKSYLGMRKIHTANGMVYLNNRPFYQKLVLDQGYWPDGLLTAPNDADFLKDITLAKKMGFNGCRKHQKTEDPRFLYWADKEGFLVWGECASAPAYDTLAVNRLMKEWQEIIERDYNHPSIVTWVPLNESWGVPSIQHNRQQQHFSQALYHYIHAVDTTRLVVSNDGWSQTETDICAIHNYAHGTKNELEKYRYFKETLKSKSNILNSPSAAWKIYADGFEHKGEPILLTEFGGIGYKLGEQDGWGYTSVSSSEEYVLEYSRVMEAVAQSEAIWGFCYTQLTDVEQEINGLLTYDRKEKCNLDSIEKINNCYHITNVKY